VPPSVAVSPPCGGPPGAPGQGDPRQRVASRSYRKGFSTTPTPYGCLPVEGTGSWMVAALVDHTKHPARMVVDHRKAHKLKGRSRQVRSLSMKAPLLREVKGDTYEHGRHGFAHTGSTPKEELVSNFPKIFKRSPTPAPRYYIYISQTKVEMLVLQIPASHLRSLEAEIKVNVAAFAVGVKKPASTPSPELTAKTKVLSDYLEKQEGWVGTVASPGR
jgi:hypothetical protein